MMCFLVCTTDDIHECGILDIKFWPEHKSLRMVIKELHRFIKWVGATETSTSPSILSLQDMDTVGEKGLHIGFIRGGEQIHGILGRDSKIYTWRCGYIVETDSTSDMYANTLWIYDYDVSKLQDCLFYEDASGIWRVHRAVDHAALENDFICEIQSTLNTIRCAVGRKNLGIVSYEVASLMFNLGEGVVGDTKGFAKSCWTTGRLNV